MASSQNVELEAAKFLQKLIQESKDEPAKLATKLYVILQHMKSSGKEHSMPYQVISRAMETVINQHSLDIEALTSSRLPLSGGSQTGDCTTSKHTEPVQAAGISANTNAGMAENDISRSSSFASGKAVVGPSSGGHEYYQGPVTHRSNHSFDQESPSSLDTRSANSQSQERRDSASYAKQGNQKDSKKVGPKRRRGDSSAVMEPHAENLQKVDTINFVNPRQGKMSKVDTAGVSVIGVDHANFNIAQGTSQMEHLPSSLRLKQEDQTQSASSLYENPVLAAKAQEQRTINPFNAASSSPFEQSDDGRNPVLQEMSAQRNAAIRDTGKSLVSRASAVPGTPFNEQQLKQLRAQCLVFLAFRNGLTPKPLHLEVALGNIFARDGRAVGGLPQEPDQKGNSQQLNEPNKIPDAMMPFGRGNNVRESEKTLHGFSPAGSSATHLAASETKDPATHESNRNFGVEMQNQAESQTIPSNELKYLNSSSLMSLRASNGSGSLGRDHLPSLKTTLPSGQAVMNQQVNLEMFKHNSFGGISEAPGGSSVSSAIREPWKSVSGSNAERQILNGIDGYNEMPREVPHEKSTEEEKEDGSASMLLPPPKYTMLEKWVMDQQKRKFLVEQSQLLKQQKTEKRIGSCFDRLKKTVTSSEDISAKTKSVIELKKLQLLALQRRLRSDFLGDFFKPIATDMDHLRSFKKHRHGRRIKQIEKYEQKMKEERQKRIRERQKEFFSDIEVHRERLEDGFKAKKERLKGFNKYVKELHKRKERIHREKIDRIQREKITLLKINDVEGYLRMVQDAKSDRVKQLLKETEKYLQKLGSKLQEAKAAAKPNEHDADEMQTASFLENSENITENEDENDQAKHYKESNEKYYLMAHSIKESIAEQPTMLHGGKLREYQMNGLRWLVSLYNNHLNGILADEMGLGKTVQVISLICYLMETKNDRGPFLVVVPSSVLPGWESEINFWAPAVHKIVYAGPPEERRRLFKEKIVHQKFNVLLTTYEYLMNKHDRPKLSKIHWHYVIIDEGHRIKNASCKLNADLKHYRSSHRLLLTGTPLQNNLEELWALLNFLLPNIFNSSEDFSQWFNKPFQSNGDNSAEEALLSEEENLLIINRLHQVLRPFVLRRLKHKVENELPEKIERLIRCEPSAYQKLLMKRVEENLGSLGTSKARSVQNSVMELRNICNHPYLSQLHTDEVDNLIPKHYLPPIIRLCGKLEMLDRLLPKLKATDHRVLFFSTMTRLLDVMEEYLNSKHYRYLRLDGHTSGGDRGALIDLFNQPNSPYFIFLLSIRAGGVGVNLQAADTVIIFDTDWNPQVDLQAQARAHRIGQKKDVLVLRFETVQTVEEQVRASAEHKLGVANQSITAGFFDNNTSAEDRREYLESLLRESKKEEAAPVLDDDSLNDLIARSESEIDIFESIDRKRHEEEMSMWTKLVQAQGKDSSEPVSPLPSRLVTDEDLEMFYEAMKVFETPKTVVASNIGAKRKSEYGGLDTQHYGRGKRAREVRSYEEQMTEEEFEKMCQVESPGSPNQEDRAILPKAIESVTVGKHVESSASLQESSTSLQESSASLHSMPANTTVPPPLPLTNQVTPPAKRGRGRPKRVVANISPSVIPVQPSPGTGQINAEPRKGTVSSSQANSALNPSPALASQEGSVMAAPDNPIAAVTTGAQPNPPIASPPYGSQSSVSNPPVITQEKGHRKKTRLQAPQDVVTTQHSIAGISSNVQPGPSLVSSTSASQSTSALASSNQANERGQRRRGRRAEAPPENVGIVASHPVTGVASEVQPSPSMASPAASQPDLSSIPLATGEKPAVAILERGRRRKTQSLVTQTPAEAPRRRGRRKSVLTDAISGGSSQELKQPEQLQIKPMSSLEIEATSELSAAGNLGATMTGNEEDIPPGFSEGSRERVCALPAPHASSEDSKPVISDHSTKAKQSTNSKIGHNVRYVASMMKEILSASKTKVAEGDLRDSPPLPVPGSTSAEVTGGKQSDEKTRVFTSDVAATTAKLPSGSKDNQSCGEAVTLHEKMERKVALPFQKEVMEEMPAVPPGFETPKRLLPQNQEGKSSNHGAENVPSVPELPDIIVDDVKIREASANEVNSTISDTANATSGADGRPFEVIDGVLNQAPNARADLGEMSDNNLIVESTTEALCVASTVEQNSDEFPEDVPASDSASQVHPAAAEEPHGRIQEELKDESQVHPAAPEEIHGRIQDGLKEESQVHPAAPEEAHGIIQEEPKDDREVPPAAPEEALGMIQQDPKDDCQVPPAAPEEARGRVQEEPKDECQVHPAAPEEARGAIQEEPKDESQVHPAEPEEARGIIQEELKDECQVPPAAPEEARGITQEELKVSEVHPAAPEETHGITQGEIKDKINGVNSDDHDVSVQYHDVSQKDLTDIIPTGDDGINGSDKAGSGHEQDYAGLQPEEEGNNGADTVGILCESSSPEVRASLPDSVDKFSNVLTDLTKEKDAANSLMEVDKSGKFEEESSHQMDISYDTGIPVDIEESSEIADKGVDSSSSSLVAQEEKSEGSMEKEARGCLLLEEVCEMDASEDNRETAREVSQNAKEKSAIADDSVVINGSPSLLTEEKKDTCMSEGAVGKLLNEMSAQMDVSEQSHPERAEMACVVLPDESPAVSNFIISGPDSLDMAKMESGISISKLEEKQLAPSDNSSVMGGSPVHPFLTDSVDDKAKPELVDSVEDMMDQAEEQDNSFCKESLKEQLDCVDDSKCDNSLDEAIRDTTDMHCEGKDVQAGDQESLTGTEMSVKVPEPDSSVEPKRESRDDIHVALEEHLPLSDYSLVAEQSKQPVPEAGPATDAKLQTVEEVAVDMKNQSPANVAVAGDAELHTSGEESPDEVKLETAPINPAVEDVQANASSGQPAEGVAPKEDSACVVQSEADISKCDLQHEAEVKLESVPLSSALAELREYDSPDEVYEEANDTFLSISESTPEINDASEPPEENVAPMGDSAVADQSKSIVPKADLPDVVKHDTSLAYHASHETGEAVAAENINEEAPPADKPQCELGSGETEDLEPTEEQFRTPEGSADIELSKFDVPVATMQDEVILESVATSDAIHVPQEHARPTRVNEDVLRLEHDVESISEALVPVEKQLATPEESSPGHDVESVAGLHYDVIMETNPTYHAIDEQPKDTSVDPSSEEAQCAISGRESDSDKGEVSEPVEDELPLQEDSAGIGRSNLDGEGADSENRVMLPMVTEACEIVDQQSAVREDPVLAAELDSDVPGAQSLDEDKPETEDAVCAIGKEQSVLMEDSAAPEELDTASPGAESTEKVQPETVAGVSETVEEQSIVPDRSAVPGEQNSAIADAESQDEVKPQTVTEKCEIEKEQVAVLDDSNPHAELDPTSAVQPQNVNETTEIVKDQSPQQEDSVISEEPKCDAVGDKSHDKVQPQNVNEMTETIKEQSPQQEDCVTAEEPKSDAIGDKSQNIKEQSPQQEDSVAAEEPKSNMIGDKSQDMKEQSPQQEDSVIAEEPKSDAIGDESQSPQQEDSVIAEELKSDVIGDESQSPQQEDSVIAEESKSDAIGDKSQDEAAEEQSQDSQQEDSVTTEELKSDTIGDKSRDIKVQSPQQEDSVIADEPKSDAIGDKSQDEVELMEVDEVHETLMEHEPMEVDEVRDDTVKEQQERTQPEDSIVSREPKLAVPESTSQDESKSEMMEGDDWCMKQAIAATLLH